MTAARDTSRLPDEPGGATRLDAVLAAVERARAGRPASDVPVLEVGCGTGNLSVPLAALGHPVIGIDVDEASIEHARARAGKTGARFTAADPLAWRPAAPPAVIVLSEVLEHLHDPERMLRHLESMLAPGGTLVLTVPNGLGPWEAMNLAKRLLGWVGLAGPLRSFQELFGYRGVTLQSQNPHLDHVQFFTRPRLARLARATGWRVRRRQNLSFLIGVFPFSMVWRRARMLEAWDAAAARALPAEAASGWLLELERA